MSLLFSLMSKLRHPTFQKFSIYLIAILFSFSQSVYNSSKTSGFYQKVCQIQFSQSAPGVDCTDLNSFQQQQKTVQEIASQWNFYNTIASLLTSIPATLIWSAWGDLNGRKVPLLLPLVAIALGNFVFIVFLSTTATQLWIVTITNVIFSLFGGRSLVQIVMLQAVADNSTNKKYLVVEYGIIYAMLAVGVVSGSTVAAKTLKTLGFVYTFLISQLGYTVTFLFTACCFADSNAGAQKRVSGGLDEQQAHMGTFKRNDSSTPASPARSPFTTFVDIIKSILSLLNDVRKTYTKPRIEHRRLFLVLVFIIFMLSNTANEEFDSALNLFVFNKPLSFSPSGYSRLHSFYVAMQVVGGVVVSVVFKFVFGVRDTGLMLISVVSLFARLVIIGLSTHNWMIWLGGAVGACHGVLLPSINAFVARAVETNEMGKILAGNNVASNIADIISTLVYSQLYSLTVDWYPGFSFLLGAGLCGLAMLFTIGLHIGAKIHMKMVEQPSLKGIPKMVKRDPNGMQGHTDN